MTNGEDKVLQFYLLWLGKNTLFKTAKQNHKYRTAQEKQDI